MYRPGPGAPPIAPDNNGNTKPVKHKQILRLPYCDLMLVMLTRLVIGRLFIGK